MSELDHLILPEIYNDELFYCIKDLASDPFIENILEIGSSSGEGSTEALYAGIEDNEQATLYCLEVSKVRFNKLVENYRGRDQVKCINMSSINLEEFPTEAEVTKFYRDVPSVLNNFLLARVLGWLKQDKDYIVEHGIEGDGIEVVKRMNWVDNFDMVLIDGSEFTGYVEFGKVYGAGIFVLDDICSFKNYYTHQYLSNDKSYQLICENKGYRSGYSVFKRRGLE